MNILRRKPLKTKNKPTAAVGFEDPSIVNPTLPESSFAHIILFLLNFII